MMSSHIPILHTFKCTTRMHFYSVLLSKKKVVQNKMQMKKKTENQSKRAVCFFSERVEIKNKKKTQWQKRPNTPHPTQHPATPPPSPPPAPKPRLVLPNLGAQGLAAQREQRLLRVLLPHLSPLPRPRGRGVGRGTGGTGAEVPWLEKNRWASLKHGV